MNRLTVLFDERCGLCTRAQSWLREQPLWVPLEFVGAGSDETARRFPQLERQDLQSELHVVDDAGNVYRGSSAWILCLWATRRYRVLSHRLALPGNQHLLRRFVEEISRRRHGLSRILDPFLGREDCGDGNACDARNLP